MKSKRKLLLILLPKETDTRGGQLTCTKVWHNQYSKQSPSDSKAQAYLNLSLTLVSLVILDTDSGQTTDSWPFLLQRKSYPKKKKKKWGLFRTYPPKAVWRTGLTYVKCFRRSMTPLKLLTLHFSIFNGNSSSLSPDVFNWTGSRYLCHMLFALITTLGAILVYGKFSMQSFI